MNKNRYIPIITIFACACGAVQHTDTIERPGDEATRRQSESATELSRYERLRLAYGCNSPAECEEIARSRTRSTERGAQSAEHRAPNRPTESAPAPAPYRASIVALPRGMTAETRVEAPGTANLRGINPRVALTRRLRITTPRPFSLAIVVPGFGPSFMDGSGSSPHVVLTGSQSVTTLPVFHDTGAGEVFFDSPGEREFQITYYRLNSDGVAIPIESCSFSRPAESSVPIEVHDTLCWMNPTRRRY